MTVDQFAPTHRNCRPRPVARRIPLVVLGFVSLLACRVPAPAAEPQAHDAAALNAIFGDEHLASDVLGVCARGAGLEPAERLEFLSAHVLPNASRPLLRVVVGFSPTHPPPAVERRESGASGRDPAGGEILSPALDLIETAAALGTLDDLRQRVEAAAPSSFTQQLDQLSLLALIDMARQDVPSAKANLGALFAQLLGGNQNRAPLQHDGTLLCVHFAARDPELSRVIVDAAHRVALSYQSGSFRSAWQRHFSAAATAARRTAAADGVKTGTTPAATGAWWHSASLPRARGQGEGFPVARWSIAEGHADNLWSHDQDYLYFAAPLRGNYDVECDVTGFGWRETQILVAGKWVGPFHDLQSYELGELDGSAARIRFAPPLSKVDDYIHYRTVARDGVSTTYFNGRPIHQQSLSGQHDPWLAVRSSPRHEGGVRDLRITGTPLVPETLRLSDGPDLTGWISYFEDGTTGWQYAAGTEGGEIQSRRQSELPRGCHQESALFYHRPMLEDGSIEYEFWYEPGVCEAHPALDRLCFLLEPDGVRTHWLTDGRFDRTAMPPDNLADEPGHGRRDNLPLHVGAWNHVRLNVRGDAIELTLNGQVVVERPLEPSPPRAFGLFHYADRTGLRVRNITWKGDWPRELPPVDAQELVASKTDFLDERLPELSALFSHDFAEHGLPLDRFAVIEGDLAADIETRADGLSASRRTEGGYRNATVAPSLAVGGDFDITASFEQLVLDPHGAGSSAAYLLLIADNASADESTLVRRRSLTQTGDRQIVQCVRVHWKEGQARRNYFAHQAAEAVSGRLRLARRGETIYYLFAENDSGQFRLIGKEAFPADDLQMNGVRLVAQISGETGSTSVLWKDLTVRAEKLSGPAAGSRDDLLATLNRERAALAQSLTQDFTQSPPDDSLIRRWRDLREWSREERGLPVVATGTDNWTSAGAALQRRIEGDFDVAIGFVPQYLDTPPEGQNAAVYLQVELSDAAATQLSLVFQKTSRNVTEVFAQMSVANDKSQRNYRSYGRISLRSVEGLRLARRGRQIVCIVESAELGGEKVLSRADVGDAPVAIDGTRILVHTGGAGRLSRVLWKTLDIRAEHISE